jgi:hypothetical protein
MLANSVKISVSKTEIVLEYEGRNGVQSCVLSFKNEKRCQQAAIVLEDYRAERGGWRHLGEAQRAIGAVECLYDARVS